jgi:thioesterase domain-containing protein
MREPAPVADRPWRGLTRLHGGPTGGPAIVFVHAMDGSVGSYANIIRNIGSVECFGLIAPGVLDDSLPLHDAIAFTALYADTIAARLPSRRVCLAGWSFGAALLPPLATRLAELRAQPERIVLLDPPAPVTYVDPRLAEFERAFALLDAGGMTSDVVQQLERCGAGALATLESRQPAYIKRLLAVREGTMSALSTIPYEPYAGRVSLVLAANYVPVKSPGWTRLLPQADIVVLPGGHRSIVFDIENARMVAEHLHDILRTDRPRAAER